MNTVSAAVAPPTKSTDSNYSSNLAQSLPASESPNSLNLGFPVHLWVYWISVSHCISNLAQSQPQSAFPNLLDHTLPVHLQTCSTTAAKCITEFTGHRPPSVSHNSLDHSLQVHREWATAGSGRHRGHRGGQSDEEYIFGWLWGRYTLSHFHLIWIHTIVWILTAG
jgi:hypothetical protein